MDQEFIDAAKSSRAERMRELGNHVDVSGSVGGAARASPRAQRRRARAALARGRAPLAAADDARGETALHTAVWNGHVQVARLLRAWASERDDGGAALAALVARDLRGETPLHVAARRGELACARCLVDECGIAADVTAREWPHATPAALVPRQCEGGEELRALSPRAAGGARAPGARARNEPRERDHVRYLSGRARQREPTTTTPRLQSARVRAPLPHRVHRDVAAAVGRVPVLQGSSSWTARLLRAAVALSPRLRCGGDGRRPASAERRRRNARTSCDPSNSACRRARCPAGPCDDHHTRTPGVADDLGGGIACSSSSPFL